MAPTSSLSQRTFAELTADGQALIPRLAPAWTDHNAHDPGITLIELFAWLTEMNLYRLGRTSDAMVRGFLRLFGVEARSAGISDTVVTGTVAPGIETVLPAGVAIASARGVAFQTTEDVRLSPATLVAVFGGTGDDLADLTGANAGGTSGYAPFGSAAAAGAAWYLGFDAPLEQQVSLYIWTGAADHDRASRERLTDERVSARDELREICKHEVEGHAAGRRQHYAVTVVWEYRTRDGWAALADVDDDTRALTLSGRVQFTVPGEHAAGGPQPARYFIRCRISSGAFDCPPRVGQVISNAVPVRHAIDRPEERLGRSAGRAGESFPFRHAPVVVDSVRPRLVVGHNSEAWRAVTVWDGIGPHERALLVSADPPVLTAGNGRIGRVPPANAEIWATYRSGGGPAGNLLPHALDQVLAATLTRPEIRIEQPFAAVGGTAAETMADARARLAARLAAPVRAITLADHEALALATPGVPVGRVRAIAERHPDWPCFPGSGCVTVVVVPRCTEQTPLPSCALLEEVRRFVDRRRPLTTELHVVAPRYVRVTVQARLHLKAPTHPMGRAEVASRARARLNAFFHPLTGGPDGNGWPIGRAVYRSEIMALLNRPDEIAHVDQVGLMVGDESGVRCGNVPMCGDELITPGAHRIAAVDRSMRP